MTIFAGVSSTMERIGMELDEPHTSGSGSSQNPTEVPILNAVPVSTTFDGQSIVDDADRCAALSKMNRRIAFLQNRLEIAGNDLKGVLASIDAGFRKPDDAAFGQQIYEARGIQKRGE
ncbi:hypothetical protein CDAR_302101 [Caerostris darwini]|uniref:Uncharacterized protein n=1 Tax=Caerostris darwini TaxID=1538125 RepID=A0AAV4SJ16_9ARAC|nr:hypothetical protein CDAR_302101 [Caerostris darwini]